MNFTLSTTGDVPEFLNKELKEGEKSRSVAELVRLFQWGRKAVNRMNEGKRVVEWPDWSTIRGSSSQNGPDSNFQIPNSQLGYVGISLEMAINDSGTAN